MAIGGSKAAAGRPPGGKPPATPNRASSVAASSLGPHAKAAASSSSGNPGGPKAAGDRPPGGSPRATPQVSDECCPDARPDSGQVTPERSQGMDKEKRIVAEDLGSAGRSAGTTREMDCAIGDKAVDKVSTATPLVQARASCVPGSTKEDSRSAGRSAGTTREQDSATGDKVSDKVPIATPLARASSVPGSSNLDPGAGPSTLGDKEIDIGEKNRRFWEANVARTRNRERGVDLKHFPNLLGAKEVHIGMELWDKAVDKMSNALVGIILGEKPNIVRVRNFAKARWGDPDGKKVKVALLSEGIFLFKFASEELKSEALYGGPLTYNRKPLVFQEWSPDKSYECPRVESLPIWVRFPGLRAHIQEEEEILSMVVSVLGKPKTTDGYTADKSMMAFARVCVIMHADHEFPREITIVPPYGKKIVQKVEYEWLLNRCTNCFCFGHLRQGCDRPSLEDFQDMLSDSEEEESEDHCDPGEGVDEDDPGEDVVPDPPEPAQQTSATPESTPELGQPNPRVLAELQQDSQTVPETQLESLGAQTPLPDEVLNKCMDDFEKNEEFKMVMSKKKLKQKLKDKESEKEEMDRLVAFANEGWSDNTNGKNPVPRALRSSKNGVGSTLRGIGNKPPNIQ